MAAAALLVLLCAALPAGAMPLQVQSAADIERELRYGNAAKTTLQLTGPPSTISFRALDSFPIRANTTVTIKCNDHILDLVSRAGHVRLPLGATLAVEHCNLLTYIDWDDVLAASELGPGFGPASFLGSARGAVFRARNSSVQYAHVVGHYFDLVAAGRAEPTAFTAKESFTVGPIVGESSDAWATNLIYSRAAIHWQGAMGVFLDVQNSTFWSSQEGYAVVAEGIIPEARAASADSIAVTHNTNPYVEEFQRASRGPPLPPPVPVAGPPPAPDAGSSNIAGPLAGGLAALAIICVVLLELCLVWRKRRRRRLGDTESSRQHGTSQLQSRGRSHTSGPTSRTSGHPSRATSSLTAAKAKGVPSHTNTGAGIAAGALGSSRQTSPPSEAVASRRPGGDPPGSPSSSGAGSVKLDMEFADLATAREKVADAMAQMQAALRAELQDDELLIYSVLGRGASGTLYHGNWHEREVVLRTMLFQSGLHDGEKERVAAEAATARALEHDSVVATLWYELCNVTGQGSEELDIYKLYLVQEHCNGGTLREVLAGGALVAAAVGDRWRLAVSLLERVALGMEHMHSHDIVHGELCPSQILLQYDESQHRDVHQAVTKRGAAPKIADLGMARRLAEGRSHVTDARPGSSFYTAPEVQSSRQLRFASDVYSFGVIMWELLAGRTVYVPAPREDISDSSDDSDASYRCHINPHFPRLHPLVPLTYVLTMKACLSDDPDARPTFDEVATLLENVAIEVAGGIYIDSTGNRQAAHSLQSIPKDPFPHAGFSVARPGDLSSDVSMRILGNRLPHDPSTSAPRAIRQRGAHEGYYRAQAERSGGDAARQQMRRPSPLGRGLADRGSGSRPASRGSGEGVWAGAPQRHGGDARGARRGDAYRADWGPGRRR